MSPMSATAPKMRRRSPAGTLHVERSVLRCVLWRFPALARNDVGGIPSRPVMLRCGRFVRAMVLFRLAQKLSHRRDVHTADPPPGKPLLDFLEQPAVAVRILE